MHGKISREKGYCFPSQEQLAKDIGKSVRTVKRGLAELKAAGEIEVSRPNRLLHNRYHFRDAGSPPIEGPKVAPRTARRGTKNVPSEGPKVSPPKDKELRKEELTAAASQPAPGAAAAEPEPQPPSSHVAEAFTALRRAGLDPTAAQRFSRTKPADALTVSTYWAAQHLPERVLPGRIINTLKDPGEHFFTRDAAGVLRPPRTDPPEDDLRTRVERQRALNRRHLEERS